MISINSNDAHIVRVGSEWLEDDASEQPADYDAADRDSIRKLSRMRRGLLVTGDEQSPDEAAALLREVILSELDNWVPNASQRLINRAALLLAEGPVLDPILQSDHGDSPAGHALSQDWVCGIFVLRCVTCARMFKV